jgi:hypothetical protein
MSLLPVGANLRPVQLSKLYGTNDPYHQIGLSFSVTEI